MSWGFGTSLHWRLICGGKWILHLPARIPGQLLRRSLIEWIARLTSQELHFSKWELLGAAGISSLNKSLNLLQLLKPELCHFSAAEAKLALMRWFPEAPGTQLPHRCKIELCGVVFPLRDKASLYGAGSRGWDKWRMHTSSSKGLQEQLFVII